MPADRLTLRFLHDCRLDFRLQRGNSSWFLRISIRNDRCYLANRTIQ